LIASPNASATTYVRGLITVNTVWSPSVSPPDYVVTRDVTIVAPATLTIQAGTIVLFDPGVHLYVNGNATLRADGTSVKSITFGANSSSAGGTWAGIQFNASSFGSVSWSTFDRVDRAITVLDSSPSIDHNTVIQAGAGFAFLRSSTVLSNNVVLRALNVGAYLNASDVQVLNNRFNGSGIGIQIEQPSGPMLFDNRIENISGAFAVGILVTAGASPTIHGNTIRTVQGARGPNGIGPGAAGRANGSAHGRRQPPRLLRGGGCGNRAGNKSRAGKSFTATASGRSLVR